MDENSQNSESKKNLKAPEARVLLVGRYEYNIRQVADFLRAKNIKAEAVLSLNQALLQIPDFQPTHAFISICYGASKVDNIIEMLYRAYGCASYIYPEDPSKKTAKEIRQSKSPNKMNLNISSGGVHRILEAWLKEQKALLPEEKKLDRNNVFGWWDKPDMPEEKMSLKENARRKRKADRDALKNEQKVHADKESEEKLIRELDDSEETEDISTESFVPENLGPKNSTLRRSRKKKERKEKIGNVRNLLREDERIGSVLNIGPKRAEESGHVRIIGKEEEETDYGVVSQEGFEDKWSDAKQPNPDGPEFGEINVHEDEIHESDGDIIINMDEEEFRDRAEEKPLNFDGVPEETVEPEEEPEYTASDFEEDDEEFTNEITEGHPEEEEIAIGRVESRENMFEEPPVPEEEVYEDFAGLNTGVAVLNCPEFTGYALFLTDLEMPLNSKQQSELAKKMSHELKYYLLTQGTNVPENFEVNVQGIRISEETKQLKAFLMENSGRGISFIGGLDPAPHVDSSADPEMVAVDLERINSDLAVNFDIFIRLDLNQKYVKYISAGSCLEGNKKEKLLQKNAVKIHIRKIDQLKFEHYCVHSFIVKNLKKAS